MPELSLQPASDGLTGRLTEAVMGTVFSFDLRDPAPAAVLEQVRDWLHEVDARFSTYRDDSEISRLGRGEVRLADCHPDVGQVLMLCAAATRRTDGYFSAVPAGRLDPSGLVKGWAVERASDLLRAAGCRNHVVNGGGDVQTSGRPSDGSGWVVGIVDPFDRRRILQTVTAAGTAVATSGGSERGAHVVNPRSGRPATGLVSVTVTSDRITDADVLATAAVARGAGAGEWLDGVAGAEAMLVAADGTVTQTGGWTGRPV